MAASLRMMSEKFLDKHQRHPIRALLLSILSVALIMVLIHTLLAAIHHPYTALDRGVYWAPATGLILNIEATSPAFDVGLRPGDIVTSIEGINWAGFLGIDSQQSQTSAFVSVSRDDEQISLILPFIKPQIEDYVARFGPLVVALVLILFGFIVWSHKPYDSLVIVFLITHLFGAAAIALERMLLLYPLTPLLYVFSATFVANLGASLIHLHLLFPIKKSINSSYYSKIILLIYAFAMVFSPLLGSLLWPNSVQKILYETGSRIYFALCILVMVVLLFYDFIKSSANGNGTGRRKIRLIVFGSSISFLQFALISVLPGVIADTALVGDNLYYIPMLIVPLSYGIAIRRDGLLSISRMVNRYVVNITLTLIILIAMYIIIAIGLPFLWGNSPLGWGLIVATTPTILPPIRKSLTKLADKWLYDGWYDSTSVITEISLALSGTMSAHDLAQVLVERLGQILCITKGVLILPIEGNFTVTYSTKDVAKHVSSIPHNGTISDILLKIGQPVTTPELKAAIDDLPLNASEQFWLDQTDIILWIPFVKRSKLEGLLLLGPRMDEEPLTADDRHMLMVLSGQAATAAENISLLNTLRARVSELAEVKERLIDGREEERKSLAQEIHDGPMQDLIALRFQINQDSIPVEAFHSSIQKVVNELRHICGELRPPALVPFGLSKAIEDHIEDVIAQYPDVSITVRAMDDGLLLSERLRLSLFRIFHQAVTNAIRHGHPRNIFVEFNIDEQYIKLRVEDDGCGFTLPDKWLDLAREKHYGILSIAERADAIGGRLNVKSAPEKGTSVQIIVPRTFQGNMTV